jgi:hypothetical protein
MDGVDTAIVMAAPHVRTQLDKKSTLLFGGAAYIGACRFVLRLYSVHQEVDNAHQLHDGRIEGRAI